MTNLTKQPKIRASEPKLAAPARRSRRAGAAGWAFSTPYAILLILFGVLPAGYAIYLAFTNSLGQFVGFGQFIKTAQDYRFVSTFTNVAIYVVIWVSVLTIATVVLALMVHQRARFTSSLLRFLFYIPGALAGVASVLVWLFMLDPVTSPFGILLKGLGFESFREVILPPNLPVIFVLIAFWTGAGGWIVIMYGALNNIPAEVMDAARVDGANRWQLAWNIQIPMISRWIVYMAILAFAAGTQLFVEPSLVATASAGGITTAWSPNQLAYTYAFRNGDFNGSAAISIYLLILAVAGAFILVARTGLFKIEDDE
ncbi:carbohydrate ABC transporter permease [Microbacterium sp. NPDC090218]